MTTLAQRDILGIADLSATELKNILELAVHLKQGKRLSVSQKVLGLLFYKASTRTRVSFSVAMYQLGGQVIDLNPSLTQVGRGESLVDTARVLGRYLDILAVRTYKQEDLETFANHAEIPIINALTDLEHPCQILADLLTIKENLNSLSDITVTYLGDGNNVAHSLILGGALMGMKIRIATPNGYQPNIQIVEKAKELAVDGFEIMITNDPIKAAKDAQVLYTDVWTSMGQENLATSRIPLFEPYQVNETLLNYADKEVIVLHCLPAHRGEEITDTVIEGKHSRVWEQAENRMHAQKALIVSLLGVNN
ncbi:ornithine carbamoyltransferase [Cyanobacterium sp. uoEpiScrs1]|uniref:ornithine carbamoyltransferase n=1 Tax=Cyanobacterium sp. uoEpiScrs1 TaxID=2976343 RepID=UPI002269F484|nr:ornithine carbamoyltransferase [Cyanobacterium sp. uoEpiScrs1]